jgi:hypothetical protein
MARSLLLPGATRESGVPVDHGTFRGRLRRAATCIHQRDPRRDVAHRLHPRTPARGRDSVAPHWARSRVVHRHRAPVRAFAGSARPNGPRRGACRGLQEGRYRTPGSVRHRSFDVCRGRTPVGRPRTNIWQYPRRRGHGCSTCGSRLPVTIGDMAISDDKSATIGSADAISVMLFLVLVLPRL